MQVIQQTYQNPVANITVPKALLSTGFRVSFESLERKTTTCRANDTLANRPLYELMQKWKAETNDEDWSNAFDFEDEPEKEMSIF